MRALVVLAVGLASVADAAPIQGTNAEVFEDIYKYHKWGCTNENCSLSGSGSTLGNTKTLCSMPGRPRRKKKEGRGLA